MPKLYRADAVILKRIESREADDILTLYTLEGKLRVVARGARRSVSKLGGHIEPLTHSRMQLAQGNNLDIVTQSQTLESFLPLRSDLWCISYALYIAEMVDRFTDEGEANPHLFKLLLDTLRWLCRAPNRELPIRYFELHLPGHLGYKPELQQCVSCNMPIQRTTNFFSASGGGVLCPRCRDKEPVLRPLSLNGLRVLRFLQRSDCSTASRLRMNHELSLELGQLLQGYTRHILEQDVKSARWIDHLKKGVSGEQD